VHALFKYLINYLSPERIQYKHTVLVTFSSSTVDQVRLIKPINCTPAE